MSAALLHPAFLILPLLVACQGELQVDLGVTDDARVAQVSVAIPRVELVRSEGDAVVVVRDDDGTVPLLDYRDAARLTLLPSAETDNGSYAGVRPLFAVSTTDGSDTYVERDDGTRVPLTLGTQNGLGVVNFTIDSEAQTRIVVELELPFSLIDRVDSLGSFQLIPVFRAADADTAGSIEGDIDELLIESADCRAGREAGAGVAVYLFAGRGIFINDYVDPGFGTTAGLPIGSAAAHLDSTRGVWTYRLRNVAPGSYTLALTCQADREDPLLDDAMSFIQAVERTVSASETVTLDF